jgi:class 3 adenylate cyclase
LCSLTLRSMMEMSRELNDRHPGIALDARAGVCTGDVVVAVDAALGDAIATGDVVNTASRLRNAAPRVALFLEPTSRR